MIRYRARWVLPIARPPIPDGVVAVEGGRIAFVGPPDHAPSGTEEHLGDALLLPGLVNTHTHLELTVMRGFLEGLPFDAWIRTLTAARAEVLTDAMLLDACRLGIVEGLRRGITTYADTSPRGLLPMRALAESGVRGIVYQEVFGPDASKAERALAELRETVSALREHATSLVRIGISPHAPFSVSDELFRSAAEYSAAASLPIAVHIGESDAEVALVRAGEGAFADRLRARGIAVAPRARSSIDLLLRQGVLERRPLLIHCVRVDGDDIRCIAAAGAGVAHCPISNAKLGHGIAPLGDLLAAGIPVGLGTDSVAANNRMDLLEEARMAVLMQRVKTGRPDAISARVALDMATIGGARALGLEGEIGTLEEGKSADLVAFPLGASGVPVFEPEAAAVFALGGSEASLAVVGGSVLLRGGLPLQLDPGLESRVQRAGGALREWAGAGSR